MHDRGIHFDGVASRFTCLKIETQNLCFFGRLELAI